MNYTIEGKGPSPVPTDDVRARDAATRAAQAKHILPHVARYGWDADLVADVCGAIAVLVASIVTDNIARHGEVDCYFHTTRREFLVNVRRGVSVFVACDDRYAATELTHGLGIERATARSAWNAIVPLLRGANGVLDGITLTDDPNDAAIVHCAIAESP